MAMNCLEAGGEMGARMRALDWSRTPLGDVASWPQSLRTSVSTCLSSRFPIIIGWGPKLVTIYNDAYAPIAGEKHPSLLGKPWRECWPEVWHIVGPMLAGVLERGEGTWSEQQMLPLTRRGFVEECYFTFSCGPIRDESGRVGGVFTAVSEVTDHVLSQRRIEVLHRISQKAAGAMTVADACRLASEALATDLADVPFALIYEVRPGRTLSLAGYHGIEPGTDLSPARCRIDDGAPWRMGELVRTPGATAVFDAADKQLPGGLWPEPTRTVLVQPLVAAGATLGLLVTGVSARLAFDARYRGFHEVLASHLSSVVGGARAYEQERARATALAEFDRAKTAFFSNVSHEFRTPLSLILGPVQSAASTGGALAGDDLAQVMRNTQRLHKLVNQLLDFARIEARRAAVYPRRTDLAALTKDLASAFRSTIERGGLALVVDTPPLRESVRIDPEVWEKIVLNLVSNAFKFTFEGTIEVSLHERGEDIELRVRDTGVGIASEHLPHLFERFHRIEGVRSRSHEGTGIGLALVQDLVHLQGGQISVVSTEGRGTEFTVTIPRVSAALGPEPVMSSAFHTRAFVEEARQWLPDRGEEPGAEPATGLRVLLADDNADMRDYIKRLLSGQWRVTAVSDGVAALERARAERPDLVLADVMMPNLSGLDLVREMRADPRLSTIPIILLSARAGDEAVADGLRTGADDYVVKPFTASMLQARVEAQLAVSRAREAAHEERRRLFAALLEAPIHFAVFTGPDLVVDMLNPRGLAMWFRGAEVVGKPMLEAFPELSDQPFAALMRETLRTRVPRRERAARVKVPISPGSSVREDRYFDFVYEPIQGEDSMLMIAVDVTDQVRSREVVEEALAEARRANQAKDEFLALLGHELRNPMAPIVTALEMMQLRGDCHVTREREVIDRQAHRLMHLVDDLLDVSRVARGRVELARRQVSIAEIIARSLEATRPLIEQRRHHLEVSVPDNLFVFVDPQRMGQVFSNLLTNAAKYTPSCGQIDIDARLEDRDVVVTVRDSGIGIAPEMLPHVFEMFTQDRQVLDRSQGGLGLGLAIVRGLVQKHGGAVVARSEGRGRGTELEVRLPASVATSEAVLAVAPAPPEPVKASTPRRVLIVDDNGDAAALLAEAVSALGHEARVAYDGPTALRVAESFAPEVALLDLGLPIMDGYELGRRLKAAAHDGGRAPQLIAVTGYGLPADRERTRGAGFAAHVVKPVDMARLAAVIDELPAS